MTIMVGAPQQHPGQPWAEVLGPIGQILSGKIQQYQAQQKQMQEGNVLQEILSGQDMSQDPIGFLRSLSQAQSQGVRPETLNAYVKSYPKILEQERKGKQFQQEQQFWQSQMGGNPQAGTISQDEGITPEMPKTSERMQSEQPTEAKPEKQEVDPIYASQSVNPAFFRKNPAAFEQARLSQGEQGFKRHQKYIEETGHSGRTQKHIQDSIRRALNDIRSGKTSGFSAKFRDSISRYVPSIKGTTEKEFENAMKALALEEFASTPGFRSQGEFFVLQNIYPKLGDKKKAQELVLKAYMDSSQVKQREDEIIQEIISKSPRGEVPLNLREMVDSRINEEWRKVYARRFAEDPEIWTQYIKENPDDPMFKGIEKVKIPASSINWDEYIRLIPPGETKPKAVHKSQKEQKLKQGYKEV